MNEEEYNDILRILNNENVEDWNRKKMRELQKKIEKYDSSFLEMMKESEGNTQVGAIPLKALIMIPDDSSPQIYEVIKKRDEVNEAKLRNFKIKK